MHLRLHKEKKKLPFWLLCVTFAAPTKWKQKRSKNHFLLLQRPPSTTWEITFSTPAAINYVIRILHPSRFQQSLNTLKKFYCFDALFYGYRWHMVVLWESPSLISTLCAFELSFKICSTCRIQQTLKFCHSIYLSRRFNKRTPLHLHKDQLSIIAINVRQTLF